MTPQQSQTAGWFPDLVATFQLERHHGLPLEGRLEQLGRTDGDVTVGFSNGYSCQLLSWVNYT